MSMPSTGRRAVVVGGGVIGVACAHYLARAGFQVAIVERSHIGSGASHGNCGFVCPSHVLPLAEPGMVSLALKSLFEPNSPFKIKPRLDPALWSWLLHFAIRCNEKTMIQGGRAIQPLLTSSLALYRELVDREGLDCEFQTCGLLFVYQSAQALEAYAHTNEIMSMHFECPARRLDSAALLELEPALADGLAGAWYYQDDAHLRPDRLMSTWRARLQAEGIQILENQEFRGFAGSGDRALAARTTVETVAGDLFVIATGAWTPLLRCELGVRLPIEPGKGYSLTMPRPSICPAIPLIFPETRVAVTPFQSGYRLGSTMEFAGFDETIRPERLALLKNGARNYLREPYGDTIEEEWFGWRPMTYDSLPIIDRSRSYSNVYIAAGHNMLGLSMAPATGKLIAELASGRSPHIDPFPYRGDRF